jgi:hypothetical protein
MNVRASETVPRGRPAEARGRDFVIFFDEKEGTTPIIRLLNNFSRVEVIRTMGEWEPFDRHACGPIQLSALRRCLDLVFSRTPVAEINELYERTATRPLSTFRGDGSIGFKMRFTPPEGSSRDLFSRLMVDVLKRHDVLVFLAVRQDLLRWALSKYHGDGTGRPGHLQFRLGSGKLARNEIPRMTVDTDRLERTIERCEAIHAEKRRLMAKLQDAGVDVVPVRYEDFLADPAASLVGLMAHLGHEVSDDDARRALARGAFVERVHGDDLSEFFVNAAELESRFGDRFEPWP